MELYGLSSQEEFSLRYWQSKSNMFLELKTVLQTHLRPSYRICDLLLFAAFLPLTFAPNIKRETLKKAALAAPPLHNV